MKQHIWLIFDLTIYSDYEGMYYWLDTVNAKECGDSTATFTFEYNSDLVTELTEAVKNHVNLQEKDRIYVIFTTDDGTLKGRFIFGKRRGAPWAGLAAENEDDIA
ncbi:MAG: hypothetical protein SFH39_15960 [Candidatus Magnetobacterium sp. LHC-1]|nr:hypothetical protein [Nitrospirota bacterium]